MFTEMNSRVNPSVLTEGGKGYRKNRFGWGIKNLVLYIVIVNSIKFGQGERMWPVFGKGFFLYCSCLQIPSNNHYLLKIGCLRI